MVDQQSIMIRAKQIGVLLRHARLKTGKSMKEVGELLGVSSSLIKAYESGRKSPSLSELEAFAYIYELPLEHFLADYIFQRDDMKKEALNWEQIIKLRNRIIGTKLCKVRMDQGKSLKDVAQTIGVSPRILRNIELGDRSIPLPLLEELLEVFNLSMRDFFIEGGVVGEWLVKQRAIRNFSNLPIELQEFVTKPINKPYLELAQRLSEMSVDKLREVAEGLLEITL